MIRAVAKSSRVLIERLGIVAVVAGLVAQVGGASRGAPVGRCNVGVCGVAVVSGVTGVGLGVAVWSAGLKVMCVAECPEPFLRPSGVSVGSADGPPSARPRCTTSSRGPFWGPVAGSTPLSRCRNERLAQGLKRNSGRQQSHEYVLDLAVPICEDDARRRRPKLS